MRRTGPLLGPRAERAERDEEQQELRARTGAMSAVRSELGSAAIAPMSVSAIRPVARIHAMRRPRRRPSARTSRSSAATMKPRPKPVECCADPRTGTGPPVPGKRPSITDEIAATAMIRATRARWVRRPKLNCGRTGTSAGQVGTRQHCDREGDEVLDVPQQPGVQHHGDQVGEDAHPHASAPDRLHDCGQGADQGEAAGRDAEVVRVAELASPCPAAVVERQQEQRGEQRAQGLAADRNDQRPHVTDATLVHTRRPGNENQDRDVEDRLRREGHAGHEGPPAAGLQCRQAVCDVVEEPGPLRSTPCHSAPVTMPATKYQRRREGSSPSSDAARRRCLRTSCAGLLRERCSTASKAKYAPRLGRQAMGRATGSPRGGPRAADSLLLHEHRGRREPEEDRQCSTCSSNWSIDVAASVGQDPPTWFETTADDPGPGQARLAVEQGATTVLAWGGDGTLMGVASHPGVLRRERGHRAWWDGKPARPQPRHPTGYAQSHRSGAHRRCTTDRPAGRLSRSGRARIERRDVWDGLGRRHDGRRGGAQANCRLGRLRSRGRSQHWTQADAATTVCRRRPPTAPVRPNRPRR